MLTISVDTLLDVLGAELLVGSRDTVAAGVCVDSRCLDAGCIFVALPGEHSDGHDFALAAVQAGARILIVSRSAEQLSELMEVARGRSVAVVRVDDPLRAIQVLAAYHRSRLHCEVLGITGSTGKTSTKDFVMAALATRRHVAGTQGNRNNELGVPLTVLAAGADTELLVVEMGMRGKGQIEALCAIAGPTLGLVTNVGTSHIELLGSQDEVAKAKGELVKCLPESGAAFLNGDDEYSPFIASMTRAPVTLYGLSESCSVRAENIELGADSRASFTLVTAGDEAHVVLPVPGRHNVYNALAAAAVALHVGVSAADVAVGLAEARMSEMRMQVVSAASGLTIVDDSYNANPTSMRAAVDTLTSMEADGKRIAVLGDMAELGTLTELAHFQVGERVARAGIDELVTVGDRARRIAEGAAAEGMGRDRIHVCGSIDQAADTLHGIVGPKDIVLVKASRVMGLEALVDRLVGAR